MHSFSLEAVAFGMSRVRPMLVGRHRVLSDSWIGSLLIQEINKNPIFGTDNRLSVRL
jgi:hypothetical protein